ncbi:uncharacterized protein LOC124861644 isoform X2 [Girardinichthys multiradiatus]|uniref:uncharacterized protein LOC124861644 isoform X2 n=1 Tax=Girardinichthys multiradiatus TaxID=208333 RepID=UPI001FABB718|nr:uncharacterized protein LOC124861644 isoform X2 [Girardinichthys multiradiatus]
MLPIMFVFRTLVVLVVLIITDVKGANLIYKTVGDSVVLNPGPLSGPISSTTWKHKSDLALEWFGTEIICYREFKGRCDVDRTSGSLIINNLTLGDSGIYSPEINNKELDKMDLLVLQPVSKPTVSIQCNNEKTFCNLICEANITAEFGSVTYKWKNEDRVLSNSKELEIKTEKDGSSFICELENFVSNASIEAVINPFSSGNNPPPVIVSVVITFLILIVILIGVVLFLKYKKGCWTRFKTMDGDVATRKEETNNSRSDEAPNGAVFNVSPGTSSQNEHEALLSDTKNPAECDVFPSEAMKTADQDQNSEQGPFGENQGESDQDIKTEEAQKTSEGSEISSEKNPNCDQPAVSADVHREPANVSWSNEGSNQNLPNVSPGTSSQNDEVQNSGVKTENLDQAEPAKESVAVEIPENRDVAGGGNYLHNQHEQ